MTHASNKFFPLNFKIVQISQIKDHFYFFQKQSQTNTLVLHSTYANRSNAQVNHVRNIRYSKYSILAIPEIYAFVTSLITQRASTCTLLFYINIAFTTVWMHLYTVYAVSQECHCAHSILSNYQRNIVARSRTLFSRRLIYRYY